MYSVHNHTNTSISIKYKCKMFVSCMHKYVTDDVTNNTVYKKIINKVEATKRHRINVLVGCIFSPISVLMHGIPLLWKIFVLKRVILPYFEVIITNRCSLRCEYCSDLMPYYNHPRDVPLEQIRTEIERLMEYVDEIIMFRVIGGEPFMHPHLTEILHIISAYTCIGHIEIPTNGTIPIKSDDLINSLKSANVSLDISDYGYGDVDGLCDTLDKHMISYSRNCNKQWFDTGGLDERRRSALELKRQFSRCFLKCINIYENKIWICSRSSNLYGIGTGIVASDDYFDLVNNNPAQSKAKLVQYYYRDRPVAACDRCDVGDACLKRTVEAGRSQLPR